MLWAVATLWIRHLPVLDRLREGIGLQAFAQVDPLVAYKREAYKMYTELLDAIRGDVVRSVFSLQVMRPQAQAQAQAAPEQARRLAPTPSPMARNIRTNRDAETPQTVRKSGPQVGRNDPCWCGSGKKYKHCHMQSDQKQGAAPQRAGARR